MSKQGLDNISRRQFVRNTLIGGFAVLPVSACKPIQTKEYLVSAVGSDSGNHEIGWWSVPGGKLASSSTPFRGHSFSTHPDQGSHVLAYARRPGNQCIELDLLTGKVKHAFTCEDSHHLFGHGCYSQDGNTLFTSEANFERGVGVIGIRDARTYQKLGEYRSHGIGPHEIKLLPDGKTLVVANGGIRTHPNTGRDKLNLSTMQSELTYIDVTSGQRLDSFAPTISKASIRHIDVADDGTVAVAMQVQREAMSINNTVSLCAIQKPGHGLELISEPEAVMTQFKDYIGSVAINNMSRIAGFTSPRGNVVGFWQIDTHEYRGTHRLHGVCGICVSAVDHHFVISNSLGQIRYLNGSSLVEDRRRRLDFPAKQWDNHLVLSTLS